MAIDYFLYIFGLLAVASLSYPVYRLVYLAIARSIPGKQWLTFLISTLLYGFMLTASIFISAMIVFGVLYRMGMDWAISALIILTNFGMLFYVLMPLWVGRAARRAYRALHPEPKLQIWMQDLLAATFVFGFGIMLIFSIYKIRGGETRAVPLVFVAEFIGSYFLHFFIILDVCRVSPPLQRGTPRLLFVAGMLIVTSYTGALIPWWAWRQGLWRERLTDSAAGGIHRK